MTARKSDIVGESSGLRGKFAVQGAMSTEGESMSEDTETADARTCDTGEILNPNLLISMIRVSMILSPLALCRCTIALLSDSS